MSLLDDWKLWWKETESERPEYQVTDKTTWRVASKYRNPEDGDWWFTNGYKFYENWVTWRANNPHMKIARVSEETIGVELELLPKVDGIVVKMYVDRVFWNVEMGTHTIVDIKTGKTTPQSSLQLGFYAYGLRKVYGIEVTQGHYWMARKGELSPAFDLAAYSDDKIETLVRTFDKARKGHIFLPNFDACNMCGITAHCEWYIEKEKNE